jgi:2'-5' RNA ligase
MRLFYGIELNDSEKESIKDMLSEHNEIINCGRLTDWQNYHLTVKFIGQVADEDLENYSFILDQLHLPVNPVEMVFDRIGTFVKKKGNVIWLGTEQNVSQMNDLLAELEELLNGNAQSQAQAFVPHITLSRNSKEEFTETIKPLLITIDNISLFESKRVEGVLRYIPVHQKKIILE